MSAVCIARMTQSSVQLVQRSHPIREHRRGPMFNVLILK
jgi:hypothetical protein